MAAKKKAQPKKKTVRKKRKTAERRLEKELIWIIGFMVALVIVFLVASSIFKSFNSFEYEGLTFTKERYANIPVYHYYYYFTGENNQIVRYNLYLRTDPRENSVMVNGDPIEFDEGNKPIFVSVDDERLQECRFSTLAVGDLSQFLTDNQLNVRGAILNETRAELIGQRWATCDSTTNKVIEIKPGDETKIIIDKENACYELIVADCDILPVTEKFKLQSILDARQHGDMVNATISQGDVE